MFRYVTYFSWMLIVMQISAAAESPTSFRGKYPLATRGTQVDNYHGTMVADPYRWLEELDSPATKAWVQAENELTQSYLQAIPERAVIEQRLTQLWNYERYSLPVKRGGKYFFTRNDGLKNQSVLYVAETLGGPERILLDPNTLAADGTVALTSWSVSDDGRKIAYSLATAGSDWNEWRVLDVATAQPLADRLRWVKFSGASWAHDQSGFYYGRFAEPPPGQEFSSTNYFHKLYFHKLGDPQEKDELIYERPDEKTWSFGGEVTDDGRFLVISVSKGSEPLNQVFYRDLTQPNLPVVELITGFDADYNFVDNEGSTLYFVTDSHAPRHKLIAVDIARPEHEQWTTVIAETADTLQRVSRVGECFIASYMHHAHTAVKVFSLSGQFQREVSLPGLGSAGGFGGRRSDTETFFSFTNYTTPAEIHQYDVASGEQRLVRRPAVSFRPEDYTAKQVFVASRDGTQLPLMLVHRRDIRLDGNNPTILYGYGGFNIPLTPGYSVSNLVWMERGGVYAVPNLRGGGEYGKEWHEAGMRDKKQNVFDDFLASAQWLIDNKYTRPEKLAIRGGSNGGLLVGAAMTQRPELFRAAVPAVGVMDMLRFHKFTIGWAWSTEFGSADDADAFRYLLAYSPLHNLKPGVRYPSTLIVTGERDDRVVPAHSFKFAAALQAAHAGDNPVLIRIETRAGHGAGKPTAKLIAEAADVLAFLTKELK